MNNDLFQRIKKLGCVCFSPASVEQLKATNAFLINHNLAQLPDDYQDFLKQTNGFSFNGIDFYGTIAHPRSEQKYIFPDLITLSQPYCKYEYFHGKTIIGRLSESIIIYDATQDIFAVIDRINLRSRIELPSFEALFDFLMTACGMEK